MIWLSIIIPVFNVEKYIGDCIASCLNQNIPSNEYEIILINDVSSDKSIEVAKEQYHIYPREAKPEFHVIVNNDSSPKGAAASRNVGIRKARGKYVWFVDSDDKIEDNCLAQLLEYMRKDDLNILRFGYKLLFDDNSTEEHLNETSFVLSGKELYARYPHPVGVWSFIFEREFLLNNSLFFIEGYMFEDQDYSPRVHWFAEKTRIISAALYYYRQRSGSVMKSKYSLFKVKSALAVCESMYSFGESHRDNRMSPVLSKQIAFMFSNALNINSQCNEPISLKTFQKCQCYPLKGVRDWKYRLINFSLHLSSLACKIKHLINVNL